MDATNGTAVITLKNETDFEDLRHLFELYSLFTKKLPLIKKDFEYKESEIEKKTITISFSTPIKQAKIKALIRDRIKETIGEKGLFRVKYLFDTVKE